MTTLRLRKSIGRSPLRLAFLLIPLALAWFALSPTARAVTPAPDGGYPSFCTAEGEDALFSFEFPTGVQSNTAVGYHALFSDTTGGANTAVGSAALQDNTSGIQNTGIGVNALLHNTTGGQNIAIGESALQNNTTGIDNTASGLEALQFNTVGIGNTADGYDALLNNTTGNNNTATGLQALQFNSTGVYNTANGGNALIFNTTGSYNAATGGGALEMNTTGINNAAHGYVSLNANTTGSNNTATGWSALLNNTIGSSNIAFGALAGSNLTTGSSNIDIGNLGVAGEQRTIRIGTRSTQRATFIAGISGATVAGGVGVIIDANGHLGTVVSSERFKDAIKPMDKASEAILALKPVTFRYKEQLDPEGIPQFGLVAEEVEKVNPALVARDAEGKVFTVRYEAVNAMLLNEFLKEHRKVEQLEATAAHQQKQIEALTAGLQRVSAQVEMSHPASQMVLNNQ